MYADDIDIVLADRPQAQIAMPPGVDPKLAAFMSELNACVVGERLFERMKWKLGQAVRVNGTIFPGSWEFVIRAVYRAKDPAFGEEALIFHWKYLEQRGMGGQGQVGWYVLRLADPGQAGTVTRRVDEMFENSAAATRTETERAFQAGFVSMYGNVPFLIGVIGMAVVFAILLVAANTMMMAARERTGEYGVLKTLGFEDGVIFRLVLAEAAILTLGGGIAGALLAKWAIEGSNFNAGGLLPPMTVSWITVAIGVGIAVLMGAVSGLIPAWQASRLPIVQALRQVQ
jgi:putative ABC transport system permease protein